MLRLNICDRVTSCCWQKESNGREHRFGQPETLWLGVIASMSFSSLINGGRHRTKPGAERLRSQHPARSTAEHNRV